MKNIAIQKYRIKRLLYILHVYLFQRTPTSPHHKLITAITANFPK